MKKQQSASNNKAVNNSSQTNVNITQEENLPNTQQSMQSTLHWSEVFQNFGNGLQNIAGGMLIIVITVIILSYVFGVIDEQTFKNVVTTAQNFIQ